MLNFFDLPTPTWQPWMGYFLMLIGSSIAGFINTIAGNGSAITLPLLVWLGLPTNVANGTNRVAVLAQIAVSLGVYKQAKQLQLQYMGWLIVPSIIGGATGAILAVQLNELWLNLFLGVIMLIMLKLTASDTKKWLTPNTQITQAAAQLKDPKTILLFAIIGIYGGFFQVGVGIFILAALVLQAHFDLRTANGLKILLAFLFTAPALVVFMWHQQIYWPFAIVSTIGQSTGAYIASKWATKTEGAIWYMHRFLLFVISIGAIQFFLKFYQLWPK